MSLHANCPSDKLLYPKDAIYVFFCLFVFVFLKVQIKYAKPFTRIEYLQFVLI